MIHAHAVEDAFREPAQHERVRVVEDALVLDPQTDERVDVEEAAVVQFALRRPPERQPVVLALQQFVQRARIAVDLAQDGVDRLGDVGVAGAEVSHLLAQHLFVVMPAQHALRVGRGGWWQLPECTGEKGQLVGGAAPGRERQQIVQRTRCHGQHVVEVVNAERAADARDLHLSVL